MEQRLLSLCLGIGLIATTAEAQLQRIVLQGSGAPQVFTDINAALAAAQPNDKLYFSGGTFSASGDLIINMPLHFIGAGLDPDSASVTSTTTIAITPVSSDGSIVFTTGAGGSTFTGIRFDPYYYMEYGTSATDDDPVGMVFERCTFDTRMYLNFAVGGTSSTVFNECVFHGFLAGTDGAAANATRCIFDVQLGTGAEISGIGGGGLTLRHCVCLGTRVGGCDGAIVENSIFTRSNAPFWQSNGMTMTNNLIVSPALVSNMSGYVDVGNILGVLVTDIFINEINTDFEWTDDLHLQGTSVGIGMATDGTDVGIYGTNSPFKPGAVPLNPHFRAATIANSTNANGDLPVNIRVAAQPN